MSIFDWFKRKRVDVEPVVSRVDCKCEHDWVILEEGEHSRVFNGSSFGKWRNDPRVKENIYYLSLPIEVSSRKVCLICGECVDTIAEAEAEILAREKNTRDREELAKKMWENCKGVARD